MVLYVNKKYAYTVGNLGVKNTSFIMLYEWMIIPGDAYFLDTCNT